MASLHSITIGEDTEFKRRLAQAGFDAEIIREINRNDDMAGIMYGALKRHAAFTIVHGLFINPGAQIEKVSAWNEEFGWGIPDEAFAAAGKSIPDWPKERLVAVILVPYLADKTHDDGTVMTGVERTFHELWACAKSGQETNYRWPGFDKAGREQLRLLDGIEHPSTGLGLSALRWEVIDLGYNRDKKPMDVRSAESSPNAGILAAAALHPQWVKSMDGEKVPFVWLSGYEVMVPDKKPWMGVPYLYFDRCACRIQLSFSWCGKNDDLYWAVPAFFRG